MANAASAPSAAATIDPLNCPRRIPGDEQSGQVRGLVLPGRTVPLSLNSQPSRIEQIRLLRLTGREEHGAAASRLPSVNTISLNMPSRPFSRAMRSSRTAIPLRASRARPSASISHGPRCTGRDLGSSRSARARVRGRVHRSRRRRSADCGPPSRRSKDSERRCGRRTRECASMSGTLSTTPVARSNLRARTRSPPSSVTSNRLSEPHSRGHDLRIPNRHRLVLMQLARARAAGIRAASTPSRERNPCIAWEAAFLGVPVSKTSDRRRQRPSISAALSPAGPAPTTIRRTSTNSALGVRRRRLSFAVGVLSDRRWKRKLAAGGWIRRRRAKRIREVRVAPQAGGRRTRIARRPRARVSRSLVRLSAQGVDGGDVVARERIVGAAGGQCRVHLQRAVEMPCRFRGVAEAMMRRSHLHVDLDHGPILERVIGGADERQPALVLAQRLLVAPLQVVDISEAGVGADHLQSGVARDVLILEFDRAAAHLLGSLVDDPPTPAAVRAAGRSSRLPDSARSTARTSEWRRRNPLCRPTARAPAPDTPDRSRGSRRIGLADLGDRLIGAAVLQQRRAEPGMCASREIRIECDGAPLDLYGLVDELARG